MRIELLDSAEKDLLDGFKFYEYQAKGLGDYSLTPFWISPPVILKDFHSLFIIEY